MAAAAARPCRPGGRGPWAAALPRRTAGHRAGKWLVPTRGAGLQSQRSSGRPEAVPWPVEIRGGEYWWLSLRRVLPASRRSSTSSRWSPA